MSKHTSLITVLLALTLTCCGESASSSVDENASKKSTPLSDFEFRDASSTAGLNFVTKSGSAAQADIIDVKATGVGLIDFDGDGQLDIILTSGSAREREMAGDEGYGTRLFRNLGQLKFVDATKEAQLPATGWASAPIVADYDGDGDPDIYVTHYGRNRLFRNDDGLFVDVTEASGLGDKGWGTSALFHDLDGDGDLDLYLCNYLSFDLKDPPRHGKKGRICIWRDFEVMCGPAGLSPQGDRVFENTGKGQFRDATQAWGIADLEPSFGLGVIAGDFDDDGQTELYVANDGMGNFWLERVDGKFIDEGFERSVGYGENGTAEAGMGLDACDLNGDGKADLVCTNFSGEYNDVYMSTPDEGYIESAILTGTSVASFGALGWGIGIRDFDLDGRWDYYVANGHVYPQAARKGTGTEYRQADQLFLGEEDSRFRLADAAKHSALRRREVSRGAAFGDLDNDGDIDVVVVNLNAKPVLIENQLQRERLGRHFVGFRLKQDGANVDAIGARLDLLDAEGALVARREVRRQSSFQASSDPRVHFGLGTQPRAKSLRVRWPDGKVTQHALILDSYQTLVREESR